MTNQSHIIGIDVGKHWFHLIALDRDGAIVLRKKLSRAQLSAFAATASRSVVAMEACCGSQYWGRVFAHAGHDVRIVPAQFVKPYVKTNKNDFNDAQAIAKAASRATMRFVPLKTTEQLELQASHRISRRLVHERTAVIAGTAACFRN
jgi:transposase